MCRTSASAPPVPESNVAVGLAKLGLEAAWVSRLGTDEFGCFIRNQLRAEGVDCSRVIYDPDHRTGIMFKETGVGETKVFYYRENSAASHLCPEDVTPALLDGVKVLHMSGITPVLSESCLAMTKAAFALAKEKGVAISFDPNIRRKLWRGQDYAPLIRELTLQSEIVLRAWTRPTPCSACATRTPSSICCSATAAHSMWPSRTGGNGAWVADKTTREKLPPYPCKPIEPIGAGDGLQCRLPGRHPAGPRCGHRRPHGCHLRRPGHPDPGRRGGLPRRRPDGSCPHRRCHHLPLIR